LHQTGTATSVPPRALPEGQKSEKRFSLHVGHGPAGTAGVKRLESCQNDKASRHAIAARHRRMTVDAARAKTP
jgi:hypothetical protein